MAGAQAQISIEKFLKLEIGFVVRILLQKRFWSQSQLKKLTAPKGALLQQNLLANKAFIKVVLKP